MDDSTPIGGGNPVIAELSDWRLEMVFFGESSGTVPECPDGRQFGRITLYDLSGNVTEVVEDEVLLG